jgi:uncharacterized protein
MIRTEQENNGQKGRFIIFENDEYAGEMTYSWAGSDKFIIDHTGIEEKFEGKGYGKRLVMKAVSFAEEKGVKILPLCPFAKIVFDKEESIRHVKF